MLTTKIARCRVGLDPDVFQSGDGLLLPNIKLDLGEDARSSTGEFSIRDTGLIYGAKYRAISIKAGGLLVPKELLESPKADPVSSSMNGAPSLLPAPGQSGGTAAGELTKYQANSKDDIVKGIVAECLKRGETQPFKIAFYAAVAEGESSLDHNAKGARNEGAGNYYGRSLVQITFDYNYQEASKYLGQDLMANPDLVHRPDISTALLIWGIKRGWCSQGGIDKYVTSPNSDLATAYRKIQGGVWGDRYQQFYNNWLPKIPGIIAQLQGGQATPAPAAAAAAPTAAATGMSPSMPVDSPIATSPPASQESHKGTELIIEAGFGSGAFAGLINFHFIHIATTTRLELGRQTTTFKGQSVRWLLTRVPINLAVADITQKQLATQLTKGLGISLDFEGDGLKYKQLTIDGKTAFSAIASEARKIGFRIADDPRSNKVVVEPLARPKFTDFVLDETYIISFTFNDQARAEASFIPGVEPPAIPEAQTKTSINRESGMTDQSKPEVKAGVGTLSGVTGKATPPIGGIIAPQSTSAVKPVTVTPTTAPATPLVTPAASQVVVEPPKTKENTVTKPDGTIIKTTVTTSKKTEKGRITAETTTKTITVKAPSTTTTTRVETIVEETVDGTTGTRTTTIKVNDANPEVKKEPLKKISGELKKSLEIKTQGAADMGASPAADMDAATGLPKQQPGVIDLMDGKAEAITIADEARRVMLYPGEMGVRTDNNILLFVPGQVIALPKLILPDEFATEVRINRISHDFAAGRSSIAFYTPGKAKAPEAAAPAMTATPGQATAPVQFATPSTPGGLIDPMPGGSTGCGFGGRGGRHKGVDRTAPDGAKILAAGNGVVTDVCQGDCGGWGWFVLIQTKTPQGDISLRCCHMRGGSIPADVKTGAQVKQGQVIGIQGTTGRSSGDHLHLEIYKGGEGGERLPPSAVGIKYNPPGSNGVEGGGIV